eukprot:RCo016430
MDIRAMRSRPVVNPVIAAAMDTDLLSDSESSSGEEDTLAASSSAPAKPTPGNAHMDDSSSSDNEADEYLDPDDTDAKPLESAVGDVEMAPVIPPCVESRHSSVIAEPSLPTGENPDASFGRRRDLLASTLDALAPASHVVTPLGPPAPLPPTSIRRGAHGTASPQSQERSIRTTGKDVSASSGLYTNAAPVKLCPSYARTGRCRFAEYCQFRHAVPDHERNPSRYTHYTLDWSEEGGSASQGLGGSLNSSRALRVLKAEDSEARSAVTEAMRLARLQKQKAAGVAPPEGGCPGTEQEAPATLEPRPLRHQHSSAAALSKRRRVRPQQTLSFSLEDNAEEEEDG